MRQVSCLVLAVLFSVVAVGNAFAQVAAGDRMRVWRMGDVYVVGYLNSAEATSLTLRTTDSEMTFSIPFSQVTKVEVSRGEHSHTLVGALVGGGVGLLIGIIFTAADSGSDEGDDPIGELVSDTAEGVAVVSWTVAGLAIGTLIGWLSKSEKWERVGLDEIGAVGP